MEESVPALHVVRKLIKHDERRDAVAMRGRKQVRDGAPAKYRDGNSGQIGILKRVRVPMRKEMPFALRSNASYIESLSP